MSYSEHSLWGYPSAEKQSVYSTAPSDWTNKKMCSGLFKKCYQHNKFSDYMVVSLTLGFMHFAFVRQSESFRNKGHCWRSKDEFVSDVLLWIPAYGQSKAGRPARTFIQQLCDDTGCNTEDLPEAMNDRETWRERGQGYPCWPHDMMMMMMFVYVLIY